MQEVWQRFLREHDLFEIEAWQEELPWKPFHAGVEIHRLYGDGVQGPSAALLRFHPGGRVPAHSHVGYEHILVLSGAQHDEEGLATAGSFRIHPPGTRHSILSETGCIVLAIYEKPVSFRETAEEKAAVSRAHAGG